jgi:hypothetical protein
MVTDCSPLYESDTRAGRCVHPVCRGIHLWSLYGTGSKMIDLGLCEILANRLRGLRGVQTNSPVVNGCLLS